jgi:hypothetical protein
MPTHFSGKVFTFRQPDGSSIELRGWGDQSYAVFETLDGFTVTKNAETGYYEVARLSDDGSALEPASNLLRRLDGAAAGLARGLRVRPSSGSRADAVSSAALRSAISCAPSARRPPRADRCSPRRSGARSATSSASAC